VERQLEALQRRRPAEEKREDARLNLAKAKEAVSRANEAATEKTSQLETAQEQWRQWLVAAGLPETLSPENASNVLARLDAAREQLKAIESDRERIGRMREAIREYDLQVKSAASTCGLDRGVPDETGAAMVVLVASLDKHENRRHALEDACNRLEEAKKQTARAKSKADSAEQLHRKALDAEQQCEQQCEQQWVKSLERLGLRSSLAVESAPQMLQSIERARHQLGRVGELRKRQRTSQESMESYCRDARSVSKTAGRPDPADDDVSKAVSTLTAALDQAEENHRRVQNLNERIRGHENRIKLLRGRIEERQYEIDELLKAADASDEEAFRRRAFDYETRRDLEEQTRKLETRLRQLAGTGDALERLEEELKQAAPEELNSGQKELEEAIEKSDQERTAAHDTRDEA
jgi:uncharacterized protein YhaN